MSIPAASPSAAGVEPFPEAAEQAAERLDHVIVANLDDVTELPYPDGHFDAMTFGDVLEHLAIAGSTATTGCWTARTCTSSR